MCVYMHNPVTSIGGRSLQLLDAHVQGIRYEARDTGRFLHSTGHSQKAPSNPSTLVCYDTWPSPLPKAQGGNLVPRELSGAHMKSPSQTFLSLLLFSEVDL